MSPNPNWPRWIRSSINLWFSTIITPNLPLFIEGTDRRIDDQQNAAELRVDGPFMNELSSNYWQLDVTIDVLIKSTTSDQNIYTPEINAGFVLAAFTRDIPVYQLGNGPNDDPHSLLGCLLMTPRPAQPIIVTNFGQIDPNIRVRQSTIEANYRMNLTQS